MSDYNGSERHKRYKKKVANLLRNRGFKAAGDRDDEFTIFRDGDSFPYSVDVCASNGERNLIIEIDGYKGHKSRRGILHDMHRTNEIKDLVKDIEVFRLSFWQLKGTDDETILQELKIY